MALPSGAVYELRSAGSNSNAGGFVWLSLVSSTYKWTASGSGTNEYYCEIAAGGDPSLTEVLSCYLDGLNNLATNGTLGSLAVSEWDWGDNDSLGYSTVYVRLADGIDPDTKKAGFVGIGDKGGKDYSQQDSAHATYSDLVVDAVDNTKVTSAATPFNTDDINNFIAIIGTGDAAAWTIDRYHITDVDGSNIATLHASPAATGSTGGGDGGGLGGAVIGNDFLFDNMVAGNKFWVKDDGTYTLGTISSAISGTAALPITVEGFGTTRGDFFDGSTLVETNRPLWAFGANVPALNGSYVQVRGIEMTTTYNFGFTSGTYSVQVGNKINNSSPTAGREAFNATGSYTRAYGCEAQSLNGPGWKSGAVGYLYGCYIHHCGDEGFTHNAPTDADHHLINCIFNTITLAAIDFDAIDRATVVGVTIYNSTTGIGLSAGATHNTFVNIIIDNCTTGIDQATAAEKSNTFMNINFTNNGTDYNNIHEIINETSDDPGFTDAAGGDFTVGANMQGAAIPDTFGDGATVSNFNMGAVMSAAGGGGASIMTHPGMSGGIRG